MVPDCGSPVGGRDSSVPEVGVGVVSISDFNRALAAQGKPPVSLADHEFLLNCIYKGTLPYMDTFLQSCTEIDLNGTTLQSGRKMPLAETIWMTSVGNSEGNYDRPGSGCGVFSKGHEYFAGTVSARYKHG